MIKMKRVAGWIGLIELVLCAISCKERTKVVAPAVSLEAFALDSLKVSGAPYHLCDQKLTSEEAISAIDVSDEDEYCFDREGTPVHETFFFPEKDIKNTDLVKKVQLRYNYANVLYRIVHGYELFARKASSDSIPTRKDSLDLILHDCPVISSSLLRRAITDNDARSAAENLLASYRVFDGKAHSNSAFDNAHNAYVEGYDALPKIVDSTLLDDFENHFWEWYDKRKYVPEYDQIAALYLDDDAGRKEITEDEIRHLKAVVESEKNIDRRTILSLELMRCSREAYVDAALYLGEILESGIYTKYLLEAWIAWRALVQLDFFAPSSYAVIPNSYYDKIRVKCLNTILRHIQTAPDKYDVCLIENFIYCEILHRMDAIYGNEALTDVSELSNGMFIQPSALGRDYLKEERTESKE